MDTAHPTVLPTSAAGSESERNVLLVAYALHALSVFTGVSAIAGVIVNHIKINETENDFARSHHRWMIRTFWFGLLWAIVCGILTLVLVGLIGFIPLGVWWIYRIVRGILAFVDRKPMPV